MDLRVQRIVLETEHLRISGDLHLPSEGYRSRLSDYLNRRDDQFVPLTNVEIRSRSGNGRSEEHDFLAVARSHVTLAYPAKDES